MCSYWPKLFMKLLQLCFLTILFGLFIGCEPVDPCGDLDCSLGVCVDGICDCSCGYSGVNCEIEDLCFGVICCNGFCNSQTETCSCNPNYYGESCSILCVNGEFANGNCNCFPGYEGIACEIESRDSYLGWWSCEQWTWTSEVGDSIFPGPMLGSFKFECGDSIPEIEIFPTENSNGLMLLNSANRIVGQVTKNTINFETQILFPQNPYTTVSGSASRNGPVINIELFLFNPTTSFTEVVKGKLTIARFLKDCN